MLSIAFLVAAKISVVALPPKTHDVDARALTSTVAGALHEAAQQRGMKAVNAENTKPVFEALEKCTTEKCRMQNAKRLGVKYAIMLREPDALVLVDVDEQAAVAEVVLDGPRPRAHAQAVQATSALLEQVAPLALHQRERAMDAAVAAKRRGDVDEALARVTEAITCAPINDDVVDLWLFRARLDEAQWDELIASIGPGTDNAALLSSDERARLHETLRDHLVTRASRFEADNKLGDAIREWERVAHLFDDDDALFSAVRLRAKAKM
jgi:hypothetical protein